MERAAHERADVELGARLQQVTRAKEEADMLAASIEQKYLREKAARERQV